MASNFDTVIIGAGHNGLVCAATLARAGRSVLVLERREIVGGCAVTEEFVPGFRCSATFAGVETFDPTIADELKLQEHGLQLLPPACVLVPRQAGDALYLPPQGDVVDVSDWCAATQCSNADGQAFAKFDALLRRLGEAFGAILAKPLPELETPGVGGILELLRTGWLLRRLGTREFREAMRFLPMPIADVVVERFENEALRAAIAAGGLTGSWFGPRSPGSALNLLFHRVGRGRGAIGYPQLAFGGTGSLTDALRSAAEAAGATVRTGADVERIVIGRGKVRGVKLVGGEEIGVETVISNADPKTTLLSLVEPLELQPSFVRAAQNLRSRGTVAMVKLALSELPSFSGVTDASMLAGRIQIGEHLDALEMAFDATKYGELPQRPYLDLTIPSISDPGLAPEGKHVLSAWVQFPPYHLRGRDWNDARGELGDLVVQRIEDYAPGLSRHIVDREVLSPLDLEKRFGVAEGCIYHLEPALDQSLYLRPIPRWSGYRMPIEQLYLCGSGTHGGGGLSGLAGRNAARQVIEDS